MSEKSTDQFVGMSVYQLPVDQLASASAYQKIGLSAERQRLRKYLKKMFDLNTHMRAGRSDKPKY